MPITNWFLERTLADKTSLNYPQAEDLWVSLRKFKATIYYLTPNNVKIGCDFIATSSLRLSVPPLSWFFGDYLPM